MDTWSQTTSLYTKVMPSCCDLHQTMCIYSTNRFSNKLEIKEKVGFQKYLQTFVQTRPNLALINFHWESVQSINQNNQVVSPSALFLFAFFSTFSRKRFHWRRPCSAFGYTFWWLSANSLWKTRPLVWLWIAKRVQVSVKVSLFQHILLNVGARAFQFRVCGWDAWHFQRGPLSEFSYSRCAPHKFSAFRNRWLSRFPLSLSLLAFVQDARARVLH